jgi:polysaccharide export outer membrane protein
MFMARDFVIRDRDTLYVTEAPFTQWSKVISAITGTASSASSLSTLASGG